MFQSDWIPSAADVGAILRARTKDARGVELGTFTSETRPTDSGVKELVETTVADISAEVGEIPDSLQDSARRLAALGTAIHVELSYFSEQVQSGRSPYPQLKELYDQRFMRFVEQMNNYQAGGEVGDEGEQLSSYAFPIDCGGLVGWGTRW